MKIIWRQAWKLRASAIFISAKFRFNETTLAVKAAYVTRAKVGESASGTDDKSGFAS
ncbi:MAG: hypothetical protein WA584_23295 [Pyrinomonadaceae bacterium]